MSDGYSQDPAPVLDAERERIAVQRRVRGVHDGPVTGLALSGGGIRSATFALGVLQALDKADLLKRIDYLSTVSGGGFIGTALTWFRRQGVEEFPFGQPGSSVRSHSEPGSRILAFLRQHGDYLNPSGGFDRRSFKDQPLDRRRSKKGGVPFSSLLAVTLRAAFLGTFVYGSLLVGAFFVIRALDRIIDVLEPLVLGSMPSASWEFVVTSVNAPLILAALLLGLLLCTWVAYPFVTFANHRRIARFPARADAARRLAYRAALESQRMTGKLLMWSTAALVVGSVPIAAYYVGPLFDDLWQRSLAALLSMMLGGALGVSTFASDRRQEGAPTRASSVVAAIRTFGAGALLLYGLLILSYTTATAIDNYGFVWVILPIVVIGLAAGYFANLNRVGIAHMYRDRLMEAFMPGSEAVEQNRWHPAIAANAAPLAEMCEAGGPGPYHLLNANVITSGSAQIRFRARGGDSFTLSPLYCGSDATGWRDTNEWMEGQLTLATSMAISGAAANPNAGVSGRGATRNRLVSAVMSMLGLRLGYWAPNPNPEHAVPWASRANFLVPGLRQGVLGTDLDEHGGFVELSDGGHFENLGGYELIRRRVDVILCSDAGADPTYVFDGLANLAERARVDFGVNLEFDDEEYPIAALLPETNEESELTKRYDRAQRGFAVGRVLYPAVGGLPEKQGVLIYIKPTMVEGLPPDVIGYKLQNPSFPQQPTSEQFFQETQIEAYRELGFRIGSEFAAANERAGGEGAPVAARGTWL